MKVLIFSLSNLFGNFISKKIAEKGIEIQTVNLQDILRNWNPQRILKELLYPFFRAHILHFVYAPVRGIHFLLFLLGVLLRKKIIVHWIGSDVLEIRKRLLKISSIIISRLASIHISVSPWLADELQNDLGIYSIVLPIVPPDIDDLSKRRIHRKFSRCLLAYISSPKEFLTYSGDIIIELAKRLPDYRFYVMGINMEEVKRIIGNKVPENIIFLGKVPRRIVIKFYEKIPILLRINRHDGLPNMVLEALAMAMHVATTLPIPTCYRIRLDNLDSIINTIKSIKTPLNNDGRKYVLQKYDPNKLYAKYVRLYRILLRA